MVHLALGGQRLRRTRAGGALGADVTLVQLRGGCDGPYPLPGPADAPVVAGRAAEARGLLLAGRFEAISGER